MAYVQRYNDPFGELVDDFFKGFLVRPVLTEGAQTPAQRLRVEVVEEDKQYKVLADIPGVRKEDIQVTIEGDQLAIQAETRREKEAKDNAGRVVHSERFYGKLARTLHLGQEVDQAEAQARYADGVLELTLPKKATQNVRQLSIQ